MPMRLTLLAAVLTALSPAALPAQQQTARLPVTADVGIGAYKDERSENTGSRPQVRIKGNDHYYLFTFDGSAVRNWRVTAAALHLKMAGGRFRRLAACTVGQAWKEGIGQRGPQEGSPCFTHAAWPKTAWTEWGGTLLDATFNNPAMAWRSADVRTADGWATVALAPELVEAVARGLSQGLVLAEETGQTFENHDVFTREQSGAAPYLTVTGEPFAPTRGVAAEFPAEPLAEAAAQTSGAMRIAPGTQRMAPGDSILGWRATVFQPAARTTATRRAVAFGGAEAVVAGLKPNAAYTVHVEILLRSGLTLERSLLAPASPAAAAPAPPNVWPGEAMPAPRAAAGWAMELRPATACVGPDAAPSGTAPPAALPSARNAWAGLQAVLWPPKGKAAALSAEVAPLAYAGDQSEVAPPLKHVDLYRVWYVPDKQSKWRPEVLVPLRGGEKFAVPWTHAELKCPPAQTCQAIFVDVWVPANAAPGPYAGKLTVKAGAAVVATAELRVEVAPPALADELHVAGSMNAYSSPAGAMGLRPAQTAAFEEMERKYYRLAHAHRMTLAVLPYSQSGAMNDASSAPQVTGRGRGCGVKDWTAWDRRFGPLLSGEAFGEAAGYVGPGAWRPIDHMYLPFHENWPSRLAESFRPWPPPTDYQAFLRWSAGLPPVRTCLSADFAAAWRAVLQEFALHLAARKWTRTRCQVYLNNKYYFRRPRGDGRAGSGIGLWLLDEPAFADDFLALAYFGRLTRGAVGGLKPEGLIGFRVDISRPTHQRDWLDGVVDLNVTSTDLHAQRHLIARRKRDFGEEYWTYTMPPSFGADNGPSWAAWPVRALCWGATGTLPWQTVASDGDLAAADETALLYPGRKFGLDGPLASLRMKAWRAGLQDAELLRCLQQRSGWSDVQLRMWAGAAAGLDGWKAGADPPADSPIVTFAGFDAARMERLRRVALAAAARLPARPARSALEDLRGP